MYLSITYFHFSHPFSNGARAMQYNPNRWQINKDWDSNAGIRSLTHHPHKEQAESLRGNLIDSLCC